MPADRGPVHQGASAISLLLLSLAGLLSLAWARSPSRASRCARAAPWARSSRGLLVPGLQPDRRLHRRRHRPLRRPHPRHAVLVLRRSSARRRRPSSASASAALRTAWAHYRESRRKERLRREVIRKHTGSRRTEAACPASGGCSAAGVRRTRRPSSCPTRRPTSPSTCPLRAPSPRRPRPEPLPFAAADDGDGGRGGRAARSRRPPPPSRPRRLRRRRGARQLHPAPDHHPRRDQGRRRPIDNDRLLEKGRILQAKCGEFGVTGDGEGDPPRPGRHHLRVQARRRASSTRRSSASPTTSPSPSRPSPSASTA